MQEPAETEPVPCAVGAVGALAQPQLHTASDDLFAAILGAPQASEQADWLGGGGGQPLAGWDAACAAPFPADEQALPTISGLSFGGLEALGSFSGMSGAGPGHSEARGSAGAGAADTAAAAAQPAQQPSSSGAPLCEEERQERARATNRAKQARWRERQKEKKAAMAQQFEAAEAEVERERALNHSHRLKGALLEAVRDGKDAAVALLEVAAAADSSAARQAGTASPSSAARGASSSSGVPRLCRLPFTERVQLCSSLFRATESAHQAVAEQAGQVLDWFAVKTSTMQEVSGHLVEAHPPLLESVLGMTAEDVLKDWADFGAFVKGVLRQLDACQLSEAQVEAQLEPAVMYQALLHVLLTVHRPEHEHALVNYDRLPGESDEAAAARWRQVMLGLGATEAQARAMLPAFEEYVERMQALGQEAASALATVAEVQQFLGSHLDQLGDAWGRPGDTLRANAQRYVDLLEAARALRRQPTAALLLMEEFFLAVGAQVTLLQKARLTAACHPLHPDVPSIVQACLQHHGLLPAADHGAEGAQPEAGDGSAARSRAWLPVLAAPGAPS